MSYFKTLWKALLGKRICPEPEEHAKVKVLDSGQTVYKGRLDTFIMKEAKPEETYHLYITLDGTQVVRKVRFGK